MTTQQKPKKHRNHDDLSGMENLTIPQLEDEITDYELFVVELESELRAAKRKLAAFVEEYTFRLDNEKAK
jgi:hypothetical protein